MCECDHGEIVWANILKGISVYLINAAEGALMESLIQLNNQKGDYPENPCLA